MVFKKRPAPARKAKAGKRPGVPVVGKATAKNTKTGKPAPKGKVKPAPPKMKGKKAKFPGKGGY